MKDVDKAWIDCANYKQLLDRWRFANLSDFIFQGDTGDYYKQVMNKRRSEISNAEHVAISKSLGF